jgi:hypothetical protein
MTFLPERPEGDGQGGIIALHHDLAHVLPG